jgi:hypothetical protein
VSGRTPNPGGDAIEPVVFIQSRDHTGRTIISVYNDEHDAERGYLLGSAGPSFAVHVEPECDVEAAAQLKRLSCNELVQDPWQDLSWLTTHVRDGDGYVVPIKRPLGGAA